MLSHAQEILRITCRAGWPAVTGCLCIRPALMLALAMALLKACNPHSVRKPVKECSCSLSSPRKGRGGVKAALQPSHHDKQPITTFCGHGRLEGSLRQSIEQIQHALGIQIELSPLPRWKTILSSRIVPGRSCASCLEDNQHTSYGTNATSPSK